jgi:outer membrane receptor protein involved in Fe transport
MSVISAVTGLHVSIAVAQTGLLVVAESTIEDQVTAIVEQLTWTQGPMHLVIVTGDQLGDATETLGEWYRDQASTAVVIPVIAEIDSRLPMHLRRLLARAAPGTRHLTSLVLVADWDLVTARAAIESAAKRGFDALVSSGAVVAPGAVYRLSAVNVTATRIARDGFDTPMSVTTFDAETIREQTPNGAADLFRDAPGLDVIGVGTSQPRPVIRGLLGQRILLLQDGVRFGNSRRAQDRGELPGLVDISRIERYEVVRGASSILYGSDAIGGVVNMIVEQPDWNAGNTVHGSLGYRYSTADKQSRPTGDVVATLGRFMIRGVGSFRRADPYSAPSGTYGEVTLPSPTRVEDTGVRDHSVEGYVGVQLARGHSAYARYERYEQKDAGFGFIEPEVFGEESRVQILFPRHEFHKMTVGYQGSDVRLPIADEIDVVGYWQQNDRQMLTNVLAPIGTTATLTVRSENYTELRTYGFRVEVGKHVAGKHKITYGTDFFRDRSINADTSTRTVEGFGPPSTTVRTSPRVPYARFASMGAFAQADLQMSPRLNTIVGLRYQYVRTNTDSTPGLPEPLVRSVDRTIVGAANVQYRITDGVSVVVSAGRGFRSANLVERFFAGPSPEGRGFWKNNPELEPETSWNVETGAKIRSSRVHASALVFRNTIDNGIALRATGDSVNGVVEFQNVNIDRLRFSGIELFAGVTIWRGLSASVGFTRLWTADLVDSTVFVGESYASKFTGSIRYADALGRFWAEYGVRHHGARDDVDLGNSVVGSVIPSFTVHHARVGMRVLRNHTLTLGIDNLTNTLYAEAPNVAFFRPEPRRNLVLSWRSEF